MSKAIWAALAFIQLVLLLLAFDSASRIYMNHTKPASDVVRLCNSALDYDLTCWCFKEHGRTCIGTPNSLLN